MIDQQNVQFHVGFLLEMPCHRLYWANNRISPLVPDCVSPGYFALNALWDDYRSRNWHNRCVNVQNLYPRFASVERVLCVTAGSRRRKKIRFIVFWKGSDWLVRGTAEHAVWRYFVVVHPSVDRAYCDEDGRWANDFSPVVLERSNRSSSDVHRTLSSRRWSIEAKNKCSIMLTMNKREEIFVPANNGLDYRRHREIPLWFSALFYRTGWPRECCRYPCGWKPNWSVHPQRMDWSVWHECNTAGHQRHHRSLSMYCQDLNEHRRTKVEYELLLCNDSKHRADDLVVARPRRGSNAQQQSSAEYPVLVDRDESLHRFGIVPDGCSLNCSENQRVWDIVGEPSCSILPLRQSIRKQQRCPVASVMFLASSSTASETSALVWYAYLALYLQSIGQITIRIRKACLQLNCTTISFDREIDQTKWAKKIRWHRVVCVLCLSLRTPVRNRHRRDCREQLDGSVRGSKHAGKPWWL